MLDFHKLVEKHAGPILVREETGGYYDYEDGGKWKSESITKEVDAAIFQLTARDINSSREYGEGGSYKKEDIKVDLHQPLAIGAVITYKGRQYTVSIEVDYDDHAHGLRIYIARRAGSLHEQGNQEPTGEGAAEPPAL